VIVADATVLIALAKLSRLKLIENLYGEVLIGPVVKAETVDAGKRIAATGVEHIEQAIDDGWLKITRLSAKEKKMFQSIIRRSRLDDGEAESIALASSRKLMVILDDKEARSFAAAIGLEFIGTAGVLLHGFQSEYLTSSELEEVIQQLTKIMWLATDVVGQIMRVARESKK
jgi:predicted nucleic acid-binding protein